MRQERDGFCFALTGWRNAWGGIAGAYPRADRRVGQLTFMGIEPSASLRFEAATLCFCLETKRPAPSRSGFVAEMKRAAPLRSGFVAEMKRAAPSRSGFVAEMKRPAPSRSGFVAERPLADGRGSLFCRRLLVEEADGGFENAAAETFLLGGGVVLLPEVGQVGAADVATQNI